MTTDHTPQQRGASSLLQTRLQPTWLSQVRACAAAVTMTIVTTLAAVSTAQAATIQVLNIDDPGAARV